MVRNFNYILPNAIGTPTGGGRYLPVSVPYYTSRPNLPPTVTIPEPTQFLPNDSSDDLTTPVASASPLDNNPITGTDSTRDLTQDSRISTTSIYSLVKV